MDLSAFFDPVDPDLPISRTAGTWGHRVLIYRTAFPDWLTADILLIACGDARGADRGNDDVAATAIREQLYSLSVAHDGFQVADLGTLKPRETSEGTYEALAYVLTQCFAAHKTVLLFGGSQDLTLGQHMAYLDLDQQVEYVHVDSRLDLSNAPDARPADGFNHRLLHSQPSALARMSSVGYQRYLVSSAEVESLGKQHHETLRYGELEGHMEEIEPVLRQADMVSVDLSAIRYSDAPGSARPSPGGFTVMEACRLARYTGLAYGVSSFHLSEYDPSQDQRGQTALLAAMMMWYFVDGYYNRWDDQPREDRSNLRRYSVQLHASVEKIDFYKHPGTERWWMAVPSSDTLAQRKGDTTLIPCSERDYECARQDEIPARWWLRYRG